MNRKGWKKLTPESFCCRMNEMQINHDPAIAKMMEPLLRGGLLIVWQKKVIGLWTVERFKALNKVDICKALLNTK